MSRLAILSLLSLLACGTESAGDAVVGATHFEASCLSCHGADGTGEAITGVASASDLTVSVPGLDNSQLEDAILAGVGEMPAIALESTEAVDVVAYLRDSFGEFSGEAHDHEDDHDDEEPEHADDGDMPAEEGDDHGHDDDDAH